MPAFPPMGVTATVANYGGYVRDLGGMERATAKTHDSIARLGAISIGKVAVGIGVGTAALAGLGAAAVAAGLKLGNMVFDIAAAAAPLYDIQQAFEGITAKAGVAADETLQVWKDASRGTVEATELMRNYNQATQLLGMTLADQVPQVLPSIAKVAAATGQSVTQLLNDFIRGIGRESIMILDNLGLTIDLEKVMGDFAKTIKKTGKELTKAERQQALMSYAAKALAENTAGIPDAADSAAGSFARLKVLMTDTKDEIKMALVPAILPLADRLSALARYHLPLVVDFIQRDFIPAVGRLADWFANTVPRAIRLAWLWYGWIMQKWGTLTAYIRDFLIPRLMEIRTWIADKIAIAAPVVSQIWAALTTLWAKASAFVTGTLIPALVSVWDWLVVKWQEALTAPIWTQLQTAWQTVVDYINGTLIPAFVEVRDWLTTKWGEAVTLAEGFWGRLQTAITNFPTTLDTLRGAWEKIVIFFNTHVLPALTVIGDYFSKIWWPTIVALADVIGAVLGKAWEFFVAFLTNILLPALKDVWAWISEKLGPAVGFMSTNIDALARSLQPVLDLFAELADLIRGMELPAWLEGHSPSPIENTLKGVRDQLTAINGMGGLSIGPIRSGPTRESSGGGMTLAPAYNLAIHTSAPREQVAADFGMMQALSRRR